MNPLRLRIVSMALFLTCLAVGYWLSILHPVWNDEIYTQIQTIEQSSFLHLWTGINTEGNNSPLFYSILKSVEQIFEYKFPLIWNQDWAVADERSQVILRIPSNIFISLTIVLIFYYFALRYSALAGIYALALTLSTSPIWKFWIQARPYGLWILLTTVQTLLFMEILSHGTTRKKRWVWLGMVHGLLSLTVVISIGQIVAASAILWLWGERDWRKHIFMALLPAVVCLLYYARATIIGYWLLNWPWELIAANVPWERLGLIIVTGVMMVWSLRKSQSTPILGTSQEKGCLFLSVLLILAMCGFMGLVKYWSPSGRDTSALSSRYLVNLAPVGIIAAGVCSMALWRFFAKDIWMRVNLVITLGSFLLIRSMSTILELRHKWVL